LIIAIIVIIVLIGGAILLGAGYLAGVSLEKERTAPDLEKLEKLEKINNVLNSFNSLKVIPSIVAFGEVTEISGRTVTLTYGAENLPIKIKENAKISSLTALVPDVEGGQVVPEQKTVEFKDIKIGDNLNVSLRLLPEGELEGLSVIIFPPLGINR